MEADSGHPWGHQLTKRPERNGMILSKAIRTSRPSLTQTSQNAQVWLKTDAVHVMGQSENSDAKGHVCIRRNFAPNDSKGQSQTTCHELIDVEVFCHEAFNWLVLKLNTSGCQFDQLSTCMDQSMSQLCAKEHASLLNCGLGEGYWYNYRIDIYSIHRKHVSQINDNMCGYIPCASLCYQNDIAYLFMFNKSHHINCYAFSLSHHFNIYLLWMWTSI